MVVMSAGGGRLVSIFGSCNLGVAGDYIQYDGNVDGSGRCGC